MEIKYTEIGKENNMPIFADVMIVYIENPEKATKKPSCKLTSNFSKIARYKINIKTLVFFYVH